MIERVARALWDAQATRPDTWDSLHPSKQAGMRDRASAAIEAMREPTEAMWHEAGQRLRHETTSTTGSLWKALIDAALTEPEAPSPQ